MHKVDRIDKKAGLSHVWPDHYALPMASAPKKGAPRVPAPEKTRLSKSEATVRMINATGQLLLQHVPGDVTVARICEAAGVHTDYVARYFGSREELMCQAIEGAYLGFFLTSSENPQSRLAGLVKGEDSFLLLTQKLFGAMTYLLGCGVSPERFQGMQKLSIDAAIAQSQNPRTSDRTKTNLVLIGFLIMQGMSTLGEVNGMSELQRKDVLDFINHLRVVGEDIQADLNWDKPVTRKPRSRTK